MKDPDLEDLDAGWDDAPSDAPPAPPDHERAARSGAVPDRLSKRERRAFEREKRLLGEKRRAERRAEEKNERRDAARRQAAEREAERREALERAERAQRAEKKKKKRVREESEPRAEKASGSRTHSPETARKSRAERRFAMPSGGWIIVVLVFITLGTAWYAFGR